MVDQFVTTIKEIQIYVATHYKYGADIEVAISNMQEPTLPRHADQHQLMKSQCITGGNKWMNLLKGNLL